MSHVTSHVVPGPHDAVQVYWAQTKGSHVAPQTSQSNVHSSLAILHRPQPLGFPHIGPPASIGGPFVQPPELLPVAPTGPAPTASPPPAPSSRLPKSFVHEAGSDKSAEAAQRTAARMVKRCRRARIAECYPTNLTPERSAAPGLSGTLKRKIQAQNSPRTRTSPAPPTPTTSAIRGGEAARAAL